MPTFLINIVVNLLVANCRFYLLESDMNTKLPMLLKFVSASKNLGPIDEMTSIRKMTSKQCIKLYSI